MSHNFTFSVGSLDVRELSPNEVQVFNEANGGTFMFTSDNGKALELCMEVLFKHTDLDQQTIENSFEVTGSFNLEDLKKVA